MKIICDSIFDLQVLRELLVCAAPDGTLCGPNSVFLRKSESSGPRDNCRGKHTANTAYAPRCCVSLNSSGHVHGQHAIQKFETNKLEKVRRCIVHKSAAHVLGNQQCSFTRSCLAIKLCASNVFTAWIGHGNKYTCSQCHCLTPESQKRERKLTK
jgi:hypothetical protein